MSSALISSEPAAEPPAGAPVPESGVIVRPAPAREPPFDDELDPHTRIGRYDRPLPFPAVTRRLALAPPPASAQRSNVPDPAIWGRRLLVAITEVAAGRRPLTQLAPMLSPTVAQGLRTQLIKTGGGPRHWTATATVRSVRASEPSDTAAELAATVRVGERVHAVALRLEIRHGRWCCTRLMWR